MENIPLEIHNFPRWILWKPVLIQNKKGEYHWSKKPFGVNHKPTAASMDWEHTWVMFSRAYAEYEANADEFAGIGFVLTGTPYTGVDFDTNDEDVQNWVTRFGSYAETSAGGRGIHVLIIGKKHSNQSRAQDAKMGVYSEGRYFTFTGHVVGPTTKIMPAQEILDAYYAAKFPEQPIRIASTPSPLKLCQRTVYERLIGAKNKDKFLRLMAGNTAGYPSNSEALFALINMIKFYTQDETIIRHIVEKSSLDSSRWEEKRGGVDYLSYNIQHALRG